MANPEQSHKSIHLPGVKKGLAAVGMSVLISGAPTGLSAGYDPIKPNPDQQYGAFLYGLHGPRIIQETADIAKGAEPTGGPSAEYGPEDEAKAIQILKNAYEDNYNFLVLSWHSIDDTRDKHLGWWFDGPMENPNNPLKDQMDLAAIYEPEANYESMDIELIDRDFNHLSKYLYRSSWLKNKDNKPVVWVFAQEAEGLINNPGYVRKFVEIADKYGIYFILEDYVGISFNPDFQRNPDKVGSFSYGDDPWTIFPDGYKEGRGSARFRGRYYKPGDRTKWQDYNSQQLRRNIGRVLASGEEFGVYISIDEGYEVTDPTPEMRKDIRESLPPRGLAETMAPEQYRLFLRERSMSLLRGLPVPVPPVVLIDNTVKDRNRKRAA